MSAIVLVNNVEIKNKKELVDSCGVIYTDHGRVADWTITLTLTLTLTLKKEKGKCYDSDFFNRILKWTIFSGAGYRLA